MWSRTRVSGPPTFSVTGRRHGGAYEIGRLADAVLIAGARPTLNG